MAVSAMFGPTGETPVPRSKADTYFSNDAKFDWTYENLTSASSD